MIFVKVQLNQFADMQNKEIQPWINERAQRGQMPPMCKGANGKFGKIRKSAIYSQLKLGSL